LLINNYEQLGKQCFKNSALKGLLHVLHSPTHLRHRTSHIRISGLNKVSVEFHERHKQPFVLFSEVALFTLMIFDLTLYIAVKRYLNEELSLWVWTDLAVILLGLGIFLYIFIREDQIVEQYLETTIIVARYVIQFVRITIQLKR